MKKPLWDDLDNAERAALWELWEPKAQPRLVLPKGMRDHYFLTQRNKVTGDRIYIPRRGSPLYEKAGYISVRLIKGQWRFALAPGVHRDKDYVTAKTMTAKIIALLLTGGKL